MLSSVRTHRGATSLGDLGGRREEVLQTATWFRPPDVPILAFGADALDEVGASLQKDILLRGIAIVDLDRHLDAADLKMLGERLGTVVDEYDEAVLPFTSAGAVLRLAATRPASDASLQPFSLAPITFHTEGSRWRSKRPKLLLFQCVTAGTPDTGGQTLLRDCEELIEALSPTTTRVLAETSLVSECTDTPVLSRGVLGWELTFRDPDPEPARWSSTAPHAAVDAALLDLTAGVYDPKAVLGIHWRPNRIVLLDNQRFLHGRSALRDARRVLQRVRIR